MRLRPSHYCELRTGLAPIHLRALARADID
jgi:hypothetical protein